MGTSALIRVEGLKGIGLYKHYDGYPEGTLPWLEEFNRNFTQYRGDDAEYKFAQLLRSSAFDAKKFHLSEDKFCGWGVITSTSGWFDYSYLLKKDGTVIYNVRNDETILGSIANEELLDKLVELTEVVNFKEQDIVMLKCESESFRRHNAQEMKEAMTTIGTLRAELQEATDKIATMQKRWKAFKNIMKEED